MFLHATYFYRHFSFMRMATKMTPLPFEFMTLRKGYSEIDYYLRRIS